jgi:hypothetical protein
MPAEATSKTTIQLDMASGNTKHVFFVQGTTAGANDFITMGPLTTVLGAAMTATDGTLATCTYATNVITITSAAKTYSGLVWGTP